MNRPRVLIIDDMAANIAVLGAALIDDYEVQVAKNGERGLALARAVPAPDLILLDVIMPGLDGYALCARLKADARTRAIPVIFITARQAPEDEERGFAAGAADYVAKPFHLPAVKARIRTHLELKRKTDLLERLAMRDGLTNLPNRRAFDERLDRDWRRMARQRSLLGLMILDIDDFKAYNDHYGHQAGDDCLRSVGRALGETLCRADDFAARYGGEEFGIIVTHTTPNDLCQLGERIRRRVESAGIPHACSRAAPIVTISLGAGCCQPSYDGPKRGFVDTVDGLLYRAKRAGRNQIICKPAPIASDHGDARRQAN